MIGRVAAAHCAAVASEHGWVVLRARENPVHIETCTPGSARGVRKPQLIQRLVGAGCPHSQQIDVYTSFRLSG